MVSSLYTFSMNLDNCTIHLREVQDKYSQDVESLTHSHHQEKNQVEELNKVIPITGLIMTKLDGTAKGGILLAVAKKYKLPIIALGLGEKEDDLQIFEAEKFAEAFTQIN